MKRFQRILFLLLVAVLAARGGDYCTVLLKVIDETTGTPVAGVKITTEYWKDPKDFFTPRVSEATTDQTGQTLLDVYRAAYTPRSSGDGARAIEVIYQLSVENQQYNENHGTAQFLKEVEYAIFTRKSNAVPASPDYTFSIRSLSEKQRLEGIRKKAEARNEQQATEWLEKGPNYWPQHTGEMWPSPLEQLLASKRWDSASTKSFGEDTEIRAIHVAVIKNLTQPNSTVEEVRWLTNSTVMVKCSWYQGPLAAAGYICVLMKVEGEWTVIRKSTACIS